ncbi:uncharacterized protein CLUP02_05270 [Colletotrichum lupini]|uniref:Uncharacterized protein n=1 Tax=Colletotrichum lupini TaxID=145971 RepID=A0A9Q8WEL8_9PEZI|nr:uncharacterized protein CLUP02_05270 [Colletotrichum lupini]UQC79790.1 hypothetical protein CLUP02_05270 [Colletotrichum lupini]
MLDTSSENISFEPVQQRTLNAVVPRTIPPSVLSRHHQYAAAMGPDGHRTPATMQVPSLDGCSHGNVNFLVLRLATETSQGPVLEDGCCAASNTSNWSQDHGFDDPPSIGNLGIIPLAATCRQFMDKLPLPSRSSRKPTTARQVCDSKAAYFKEAFGYSYRYHLRVYRSGPITGHAIIAVTEAVTAVDRKVGPVERHYGQEEARRRLTTYLCLERDHRLAITGKTLQSNAKWLNASGALGGAGQRRGILAETPILLQQSNLDTVRFSALSELDHYAGYELLKCRTTDRPGVRGLPQHPPPLFTPTLGSTHVNSSPGKDPDESLSTLESSLQGGMECKVGLFRFIMDRLTVEQQYRRKNLGPHGDPPHRARPRIHTLNDLGEGGSMGTQRGAVLGRPSYERFACTRCRPIAAEFIPPVQGLIALKATYGVKRHITLPLLTVAKGPSSFWYQARNPCPQNNANGTVESFTEGVSLSRGRSSTKLHRRDGGVCTFGLAYRLIAANFAGPATARHTETHGIESVRSIPGESRKRHAGFKSSRHVPSAHILVVKTTDFSLAMSRPPRPFFPAAVDYRQKLSVFFSLLSENSAIDVN